MEEVRTWPKGRVCLFPSGLKTRLGQTQGEGQEDRGLKPGKEGRVSKVHNTVLHICRVYVQV